MMKTPLSSRVFALESASSTIRDKHGAEYHVSHAFRQTTGADHYSVWDHSGSEPKKVGSAAVASTHRGLSANGVGVEKEYQGRGIASALYDHIEKHLGAKLVPSKLQTDAGEDFWKARSRR